MRFNLLNTQIFESDRLKRKKIIGFDNGKLFSEKVETEKAIEAQDYLIIPGLVDPHVHIRDFELSYKEDFYTGSKAAAAGGFTYFIDMPNTSPPVGSIKVLEQRIEAAEKSVVPCGFHFGALATDNVKAIKQALKNPRVHSVKIYMNHTTGDLLIEDEKVLEKVFQNAKIVSVHAEEEKVEQAIRLAQKNNTQLYLCHISLKEEIELIKKYKKKRKDQIFVEVTPQHLFLNKSFVENGFGLLRPPLKEKKDQEAILEAISDGVVDTIGTDHAPHTKDEKLSQNPPFGMPGLETAVPLMLNAYSESKISLKKIYELMSKNPRRIFNLAQVNSPIPKDYTLIDLSSTKVVKSNNLKTKCGWSAFENMKLRGEVKLTVVDNKIVYNSIT